MFCTWYSLYKLCPFFFRNISKSQTQAQISVHLLVLYPDLLMKLVIANNLFLDRSVEWFSWVQFFKYLSGLFLKDEELFRLIHYFL